ncbi:MAG: hypothetical protein ACYTEN_00065 [Planctomycetota bacterium]
MKKSITKIAAAIIIIALLTGIYQLTGSIDGASIVWADVVKQFNSITFFTASVYMKENATDEPVQIEIWRNSQKKARIRVDSQVLFGDGSAVVAGFAIDSPVRKIETEEYDEMGMAMIQRLFSFEKFSLDTVIASFGVNKERLKETTPLINPSAMISEDMLVFDIQSDISPEWMRIWVLRQSRLPIRIRSWDPRDGDCVDAIISYSKEQSPEFFDPDAYEKVLLEVQQGGPASGRANLAYALLKDPGGKDYTPKDLFEKAKADSEAGKSEDISGYHLPQIEQVGVTEYGAVWVMASKSQNRKPDGRTFYGFSDVNDNLGTNYLCAHSSWRLRDDNSIQIFTPEGYPFDSARPKELTLRCSVEATGPYQKETLIGNVKLDSWSENIPWPQGRYKNSELKIMLRQAWNKVGEHGTCQKILKFVRELDTDNQHSHEIGKVQLRMLIKQKNYQDAAIFAEKLLPEEYTVFKKAKANAEYYEFFDYIIAIAANENVKGATELFHEIKELKPDLSKYNNRTKKEIMERLNHQISDGYQIKRLIQSLFAAGLNLEQVNKIVGFDTLDNEETKWYVPEKYRRQKDPRVIKQEAYKKKLTEKYTANPLEPGQMILNKCKLKEIMYGGPIPEVKDHYFFVIGRDLHDFLKGYKSKGQVGRVNRVQIADNVKNPKLQHEIIYNSPDGFQWDECKEYIMLEFGLEAIKSETTETVLVAEYDGSERKDYRDVRCPAVRGNYLTPGLKEYGSSFGINLGTTLNKLARDQEIMVINNTGLDDNTIITQEVANFKTEKGMELAEQWYKENFGITFRKEQRKLPVWTIRKKQ